MVGLLPRVSSDAATQFFCEGFQFSFVATKKNRSSLHFLSFGAEAKASNTAIQPAVYAS